MKFQLGNISYHSKPSPAILMGGQNCEFCGRFPTTQAGASWWTDMVPVCLCVYIVLEQFSYQENEEKCSVIVEVISIWIHGLLHHKEIKHSMFNIYLGHLQLCHIITHVMYYRGKAVQRLRDILQLWVVSWDSNYPFITTCTCWWYMTHPLTILKHTHTNTVHSAQLDSLSEPSSDVPTVNKDSDKLEEKTKSMEMAPLDPIAEQHVTNWKNKLLRILWCTLILCFWMMVVGGIVVLKICRRNTKRL